MHAKHLIATLALTLAAGATFAALKHGHVETPKSTPVADCAEPAIPRVVVTARRAQAQAAEAPVARVVVIVRRSEAGPIVSAQN